MIASRSEAKNFIFAVKYAFSQRKNAHIVASLFAVAFTETRTKKQPITAHYTSASRVIVFHLGFLFSPSENRTTINSFTHFVRSTSYERANHTISVPNGFFKKEQIIRHTDRARRTPWRSASASAATGTSSRFINIPVLVQFQRNYIHLYRDQQNSPTYFEMMRKTMQNCKF